MLIKDSDDTLASKDASPVSFKTIYASNGARFLKHNRQPHPLLPPMPISPKNCTTDLFAFQRSQFRTKIPVKNPETFRKTFSVQKNEHPRNTSNSSNKAAVNPMLNTTSNFRPPTTSMRRCVEEEEKNYLCKYEIIR